MKPITAMMKILPRKKKTTDSLIVFPYGSHRYKLIKQVGDYVRDNWIEREYYLYIRQVGQGRADESCGSTIIKILF
jgi:hypothetical protein